MPRYDRACMQLHPPGWLDQRDQFRHLALLRTTVVAWSKSSGLAARPNYRERSLQYSSCRPLDRARLHYRRLCCMRTDSTAAVEYSPVHDRASGLSDHPLDDRLWCGCPPIEPNSTIRKGWDAWILGTIAWVLAVIPVRCVVVGTSSTHRVSVSLSLCLPLGLLVSQMSLSLCLSVSV